MTCGDSMCGRSAGVGSSKSALETNPAWRLVSDRLLVTIDLQPGARYRRVRRGRIRGRQRRATSSFFPVLPRTRRSTTICGGSQAIHAPGRCCTYPSHCRSIRVTNLSRPVPAIGPNGAHQSSPEQVQLFALPRDSGQEQDQAGRCRARWGVQLLHSRRCASRARSVRATSR